MNLRPGNRCPGSGEWAASAPAFVADRMLCPRCGRSAIRVKSDGRFYIHAKRRTR